MDRSRVALAAVAAAGLLAVPALGAKFKPAKATKAYEVGPAASGKYLSWSVITKSGGLGNAYAQRRKRKPFRVNAKGTQASVGTGISGNTLVFSQAKSGGDADIFVFDLKRHRRKSLKKANTAMAEVDPSISGPRVVFLRGTADLAEASVVLFNRKTGKETTLARPDETNGNPMSGGQISGRFAVWSACTIGLQSCSVFRRDLKKGKTVRVATAANRFIGEPAVTRKGVVYYIRNRHGCGKTQFVKATPGKSPKVIATTGSNASAGQLYALGTGRRTTVFFTRGNCGSLASDIFKTRG